MNRINIYANDGYYSEYQGWFNLDAATEIAGIKSVSGPYTDGTTLYKTASGKLVLNEWNNRGMDEYTFASDKEAANVLSGDDYNGDDTECLRILAEWEV